MTVRSSIPQHLVRAAQLGDRMAWDSVLESLARALLPHASALAPNRREAEMLLSDTLSRVFERIGQLDDPTAIVAWSRRVMVRLYVDGTRLRLRRREFSIETVTLAAPGIERADLTDLRMAVDALGRAERALLLLHYWAGLTLPECAVELGIPEGTAKSRLHAALQRLRAGMGGS